MISGSKTTSVSGLLGVAALLIASAITFAETAQAGYTYEQCQNAAIKRGMSNKSTRSGPSGMDRFIQKCMAKK